MSGFLRLLGAQARRDRWILLLWILGITILGLAAASAVGSEFAEEAERASIVAVAAASPAFLFLRGLPDGVDVGALVFFQAFSFTAVLAGLMSTFLVVRHTRGDEELGRAELLGSTPIGRGTPLVATITLGVTTNVVLSVAVTAGYVVGGLPLGGSAIAGAAVGATGLVFVGVAAVVAQFAPTGRAANGIAAASVGIAYVVRGIGDALGTPNDALTSVTPSGISWLSPIGWGQATRPFSEPTLVPLLLSLGALALLAVVSVGLRRGRDLGSSPLVERGGRAEATLGGHSTLGLAWRLQRGTLAGWAIGAAALGTIAGAVAPIVADAVEGNESLAALIGNLAPGTGADLDIVDVFTSGIVGMAGVLAAAAGVQAVLRLRAEEAEGRAEMLLATPTGRGVWVGSTLLVSALSVVVVCAFGGGAAGLLIAASSGDATAIGSYAGAGLAHAPAALVFVAVTALVFALVPRATIALGWGLLVLGLVLGQFGDLLALPEWLQNVSPFRYSSAAPAEAFDATSALVLVAVALAGTALALVTVRRRDLVT
ncbi:ABC-2 type transport system permease protein [Leifsonia sp. AK011]|uniref:ABC transporter permease n=1 Tax=Leifsonia sp. AK011 TaxID=2723075 RepID=UPI0015C9DF4E|nr:polyketide antibiotic transporter [Leifsonia sp. AK011]NYF09082.1 ABC-2 type transport system permease protein [Leifsonia sp. AK011]